MQAVAHIYLHLNQTTKAHDALRKAIRIDPRDPEVMLATVMRCNIMYKEPGHSLELFGYSNALKL